MASVNCISVAILYAIIVVTVLRHLLTELNIQIKYLYEPYFPYIDIQHFDGIILIDYMQ